MRSLKFIYSEKATKFCKIFTLLLSYVVPVKNKVKISQNFVAFSEYIYELYMTIKPTKILTFYDIKGLIFTNIIRIGGFGFMKW